MLSSEHSCDHASSHWLKLLSSAMCCCSEYTTTIHPGISRMGDLYDSLCSVVSIQTGVPMGFLCHRGTDLSLCIKSPAIKRGFRSSRLHLVCLNCKFFVQILSLMMWLESATALLSWLCQSNAKAVEIWNCGRWIVMLITVMKAEYFLCCLTMEDRAEE